MVPYKYQGEEFYFSCIPDFDAVGGVFCILLLLGKTDFSIKNILEVIAFTKRDWFIKAYVVLMIIAPVLNTFVKNSTEKHQRLVILGFFAFSSTYGWFGGANRFFVYGYGPLLFIGLYMLAQYAHQAQREESIPINVRRFFCLDKKYDIMIFAGCAILNTLIAVGGLIVSARIYNVVYAYTNPITIIGALYLLLFFSKLDVKSNKIVSMLATGSFAVYLLHSQVDLRPVFSSGVQYIYNSHNGVGCILFVFVYLVLVYFISVIIDLLRLWLWNILCKNNNIE